MREMFPEINPTADSDGRHLREMLPEINHTADSGGRHLREMFPEINPTAVSMVVGNRERCFCLHYGISIVCYYVINESFFYFTRVK